LNEKYLQKIARTISTVFIPPTFALISIIYLSLTFENNSDKKIYTVAIAFFFGFILQIASFIYFYKKGLVSDVDAKIKNERRIPFYISILIFIVGFILLLISKASNISIAFWFCYISNGFLVILINRYLKISIHTMGVAGPLALFTFIIGLKALFFLPILIAVGWSRIRLKCHSLTEVIVGALVGFISVYLQLSIFLK
jgi:membrane-associated phospholipid phosphatase